MPETLTMSKLEYSLADIESVAEVLLDEGRAYPVWLLHGNLGAGKTTLIKALCRELGIDNSSMSSPTFSIINEYDSDNSEVYHIDFYRMNSEEEILSLGIDEYFESGNFCFVEWPERLGKFLPERYFELRISISDNHTRVVDYQKHG